MAIIKKTIIKRPDFTKPVSPKPGMSKTPMLHQTYPAKMKAEQSARMSLPNWKPSTPKKFVPYYGGAGGKMGDGSKWGGENIKIIKKK